MRPPSPPASPSSARARSPPPTRDPLRSPPARPRSSPRRSTRPAPPQPSAPHPTRRSVASRSRSPPPWPSPPPDWRAGRHGRLLRRHDAPRHRLAQWLSPNTATFSVGLPAAGSPHQISATYVGTAAYATSTSGKVAEIVTKSATTTTLSAPSSTSVSGEHVTYSAMVAPTAPAPAPRRERSPSLKPARPFRAAAHGV